MNKKNGQLDRAIAKYLAVSRVKALTTKGISLSFAVKTVLNEVRFDQQFDGISASSRSLYRWVKIYEVERFDGLYKRRDTDRHLSSSLPEEFIKFLQLQKADAPDVSIPEVIRRARLHKIVPLHTKLSRTSVWRACQALNIPVNRIGILRKTEMRRFSYQHRMQMVLCDGTYFRVGSSRKKRLAIIFLDDATRYVLHAVVGTSETTELFLRGLYELLGKHGKMTCLFTDNGSAFTAIDSKEICAKLNIKAIYGKAGYPEGHGKIERFNQTIKKSLLNRWNGAPDIDDDCISLELKIQTYLQENYGRSFHEGLLAIPEESFLTDTRPLNFYSSSEKLHSCFVLRVMRKVSKDNVISIDGTYYEMPLGYASTTQEIRRDLISGKIHFLHDNSLVHLKVVDKIKNAHSRRQSPTKKKKGAVSSTRQESSGELAHNKKYKPLTSSDGGFSISEEKKDD